MTYWSAGIPEVSGSNLVLRYKIAITSVTLFNVVKEFRKEAPV